MLRLDLKRELIADCNSIFIETNRCAQATNKRFRRLVERSVMNDFKRGLKEINAKVKTYAELPKFDPVDNGMVRVDTDNIKSDDIIEVSPSLSTTSPIVRSAQSLARKSKKQG